MGGWGAGGQGIGKAATTKGRTKNETAEK